MWAGNAARWRRVTASLQHAVPMEAGGQVLPPYTCVRLDRDAAHAGGARVAAGCDEGQGLALPLSSVPHARLATARTSSSVCLGWRRGCRCETASGDGERARGICCLVVRNPSPPLSRFLSLCLALDARTHTRPHAHTHTRTHAHALPDTLLAACVPAPCACLTDGWLQAGPRPAPPANRRVCARVDGLMCSQ